MIMHLSNAMLFAVTTIGVMGSGAVLIVMKCITVHIVKRHTVISIYTEQRQESDLVEAIRLCIVKNNVICGA
jgi:hypothetical protein